MSKIGNADTFAAAAQLIQNSQRSGLAEKVLGRQIFEVNADGSIRTQNFGEQVKTFGLRLVRQFDAQAGSKDALVAQALRNLHSQASASSAYARSGPDLNGQFARFFTAERQLSGRRASIPSVDARAPAPLPSAQVSRAPAPLPEASQARPAAPLPPPGRPNAPAGGLSEKASFGELDWARIASLEIRDAAGTEAADAVEDSSAGNPEDDLAALLADLPAELVGKVKLPPVAPGFVRQNSDGSFPETAIGTNGRQYNLTVNSDSTPEAQAALDWVNEQFKGHDPLKVGRALVDAGIFADFSITERAKPTKLESPAILSEITSADRQAFTESLAKRESGRQAPARATYGAQLYQELQSAQEFSPIREAIQGSRLQGNAEATERAFLLFDQALASKLEDNARRDERFPTGSPTPLSPDTLDSLIDTAVRDAIKEFKL